VGDARGEHYLLQDVDTTLLALTPNTRHVTRASWRATALPRAPRLAARLKPPLAKVHHFFADA
jgi:hypothetical protein